MMESGPELIQTPDETTERLVEDLKKRIAAEAPRVKELGQWPAWIDEKSLVERVPKPGDTNAPGFDAGIACTLDEIPREKQKLSAILHGAYTPEAVEQIRREVKDLDPDSETGWWLAASSVCTEGGIDQEAFRKQVEDFKELAKDKERRGQAAQNEFKKMTGSFSFIPELGDDVPYGTEDGCMQGAYVAGHPFAVQRSDAYDLYFIGTYEPSLGLEDFAWSEEKDEKGRPKSGPVFGSKQFIKCANMDELKRALEVVKSKFPKQTA